MVSMALRLRLTSRSVVETLPELIETLTEEGAVVSAVISGRLSESTYTYSYSEELEELHHSSVFTPAERVVLYSHHDEVEPELHLLKTFELPSMENVKAVASRQSDPPAFIGVRYLKDIVPPLVVTFLLMQE